MPRSLRDARARIRSVLLALVVSAAASGVPEALVDHLDDACCGSGVCCCRWESSESGTCLRTACRCGGHDAVTGASPVPRAPIPPARFRVVNDTSVDPAPTSLDPANDAGHTPAPFHPPRVFDAC
jgi:hypothetical protein